MTSGSDTPRVFGRSMTPAGLLVLLMVAIDVLLWGVLGAMYFLARQMLATAIVVAGLTVPIQAGLLLTIGPLRAMATQTFRQCIRMKVAVAFIVLLAGALAIIFTQMKGDGTLAGQLRTLLSYGMGVIAFLLSVMTILLGAGLVCNDIRLKTIFSVATKPIPRWQYLLGRWMGLVMVDLALLLPSAGVVYGKLYGWVVRVYKEPDSYGESYYYRQITFTGGGQAQAPELLWSSADAGSVRDRPEREWALGQQEQPSE